MFNTPLSVAGRLPDDVLDYIVQHSMGVALNVEQMARPAPPESLALLRLGLGGARA